MKSERTTPQMYREMVMILIITFSLVMAILGYDVQTAIYFVLSGFVLLFILRVGIETAPVWILYGCGLIVVVGDERKVFCILLMTALLVWFVRAEIRKEEKAKR